MLVKAFWDKLKGLFKEKGLVNAGRIVELSRVLDSCYLSLDHGHPVRYAILAI